MDGGDVFLSYLAVGALLLFCFFYACCTNLKDDCKGDISPEARNPKEAFLNTDLEVKGLYDKHSSRCMDNNETGGSCAF